MNYETCTTCGYAYLKQCGNPACPANPSLSKEQRRSIIEAHERHEAEKADMEMLRRARERAMTPRRTA